MIDFLNAKSIVTPKGEVAIISRGAEILFRKQRYKRELLYLESTGTQYINTDYIPNTNTKVEFFAGGINANTFPTTSGGWFVGSRTAYMSRGFGTYYNPGEQNLYGAFGNQQTSVYVPSSAFYVKDHLFVVDKSGLYLNGNKRISFNNAFNGEYPLYLFTTNLAGVTALIMRFKMYYFKAWDGDILVRDFIPVLDMNDRPCMYDKVTDELFYNQGTGEFLYGELPSEARLPVEYQEVEYIEGTGTQYLDTGYFPNGETRVECGIYVTTNKGDLFFYGSRDAFCNKAFGLHPTYAPYGNDAGRDFSYLPLLNDFHDLVQDVNGVYIDGVQRYQSYKKETFTAQQTFHIFRLKQNGGFYGSTSQAFKLSYFKIYDNDTLVRDLVPCYRKSDNKPGMYELVTKTFLTNAGTGEFLYKE